MHLLIRRLSASSVGCCSGAVVILWKRLLPLLVLKQARGGNCIITSMSNPNSSMMLKMIKCWYCSREPLVRNSLWVGTNETNNSPSGAAASLVIPHMVGELILSLWDLLLFPFFLTNAAWWMCREFQVLGGYTQLLLNTYCYDYFSCYPLLHIMVQPALKME
jgi:hypothetical protein